MNAAVIRSHLWISRSQDLAVKRRNSLRRRQPICGCPQAPVVGQIINTEKSNTTEHTVCKFSATCSAFKCLLEAVLGKGTWQARSGLVYNLGAHCVDFGFLGELKGKPLTANCAIRISGDDLSGISLLKKDKLCHLSAAVTAWVYMNSIKQGCPIAAL